MTKVIGGGFEYESQSHLLGRNDVVNRWGNVASSHLLLLGLVGYWPMSSIDKSSGDVLDLSGQGRTLSYVSANTKYGYDGLASYADFSGAVSEGLTRADEADLDITGLEAGFLNPGLTMGLWVYVDTVADDHLFSKWGVSGTYCYRLSISGTSYSFSISSNGSNVYTVTSDAGTCVADTWTFVCGRFTPSTELAIWVGSTKSVNTTSIPASIFSNTSSLNVGRDASGSNNLDGRVSNAFLCGCKLSDIIVFALYNQAANLYL